LVGILHGIFVFARIAHFLRCCSERGLHKDADTRRRSVTSSLAAAIAELEMNDGAIMYSARGRKLLQDIKGEVTS
jgi:hypothetical protein